MRLETTSTRWCEHYAPRSPGVRNAFPVWKPLAMVAAVLVVAACETNFQPQCVRDCSQGALGDLSTGGTE